MAPDLNLNLNRSLAQEPRSTSGQGKPAGWYTSILLDVLMIGLAAGWSFLLRGFFEGSVHGFWLLGELTLFLLAAGFGWLLTPSRIRRTIVVGLAALGLVSFFVVDSPLYVLTAAVGGFGFMMIGEIVGRRELDNSLKFRFFQAIRPQLRRYITAVTLVGVILYLPFWSATRSFLDPTIFQGFYGNAAGLGENYYLGEVKFKGTFGEFVRSYAEYGLRTSPEYSNIPPSLRSQILNELSTELAQSAEQLFGTRVSESDSMGKIIYDFFAKKFADLSVQFGDKLLFAWGVALFFFLRGIGAIYYVVPALVGAALFELLVAFNVVRVAAEMKTQEVVEYS